MMEPKECPHGRTDFCVACATHAQLDAQGLLGVPLAPPDRMDAKMKESAFRQLTSDVGRRLHSLASDEGIPAELTVAASSEATKALRFLSIFLNGTHSDLANVLGFFEDGSKP